MAPWLCLTKLPQRKTTSTSPGHTPRPQPANTRSANGLRVSHVLRSGLGSGWYGPRSSGLRLGFGKHAARGLAKVQGWWLATANNLCKQEHAPANAFERHGQLPAWLSLTAAMMHQQLTEMQHAPSPVKKPQTYGKWQAHVGQVQLCVLCEAIRGGASDRNESMGRTTEPVALLSRGSLQRLLPSCSFPQNKTTAGRAFPFNTLFQVTCPRLDRPLCLSMRPKGHGAGLLKLKFLEARNFDCP